MMKGGQFNSVKSINRKKGNLIETEASAYLCREGYEILARNYAYRGGELDIVARDGKTVVFVEVKSVWTTGQGNPAARVNALKQHKIWNTACHFLYTQKDKFPQGFETPCRFDVLSVRAYQKPMQFEHLKNAFEGSQVIPQC
jgi:putative endonuclease